MRLPFVEQQVDERPEQREDRRLATPLLFGEAPGGDPHLAVEAVVPRLERRHRVERREGAGEGGEQHAAAGVQRLRPEAAAPRRERDGGIDETQVPAGVAAGVLVARGEEHALMAVERIDDGFDRAGDWNVFDETMDSNAAAAAVAIGTRH